MTKPEELMLVPSEMASYARRARAAAGLTQQEAAEALRVAQPSVSLAESDTSGRYVKLQARMIRELAGWSCEGPLWKVKLPAEEDSP